MSNADAAMYHAERANSLQARLTRAEAQLADAEKAMEAARQVAMRVTEQPLRVALAAYDAKWRARK